MQNLPPFVTDAEADLNLADQEFTEKAAISFWDAIERAANCLAIYQARLQNLTANGASYEKMRNELGELVPPFDLDLSVLPDASHIAQGLRVISRKGETDLAFAQIYLQMRTNKILVAGFSTLGEAISILCSRIENSFANLCNVVEFSTASQTEAINARQTEIAEADRQHQSQIAAAQSKELQDLNKNVKEADDAARQAAQEQVKRDKEDSKKLGDIQRGRKPLGWGPDDGDERWRRPRS